MLTYKRVGVVGSRGFRNYEQIVRELKKILEMDYEIVSGGAIGVDSMAQRFAKEYGYNIYIIYPKYHIYGKSATFIRNKEIVKNSNIVVAFYQKGRFKQGGTANTALWAAKLNVPLYEYEEE